MVSFDPNRPEFAPYGFTSERWTPVPMKRADRHNEIELNLLKRGSLTYLFGGNTIVIPDGRLAVFWGAIPHQIISSNDKTEYFVATIPLGWFLQCQLPVGFVDKVLHAQVILDPDPHSQDGDLQMFERWVLDFESSNAMHRRIAFLEMEARLLRLSLAVTENQPKNSANVSREVVIGTGGMNCVEKMAIYIAEHYTERLTADEIARCVGLHTHYAMSLFKRTLGITLTDCVTQHRISHSQRLLAMTNQKIIDVAFDSGFASLSRFHEAFKRLCGCSPTTYRAKHKVSFRV